MTEPETQDPPLPGGSPLDPDDILTVPVVNVNYLPEGVVALAGVVPEGSKDDKLLTQIRDNYVAQGYIHGMDAMDANAEEEAKVAAAKAEAEASNPSEEDTSTEGLPTTPETAEGATEQPEPPEATPVP